VRYFVTLIAIAPFVALPLAMATNRARVGVCCAPPNGAAERDARRDVSANAARESESSWLSQGVVNQLYSTDMTVEIVRRHDLRVLER
jgi:hypothetical protein